MKKVVLKLDFADEKIKQKAMKRVSGVSGLESIALDPKDKKLTVTGDIDLVALVAKLRKLCHTEIVSVGPAKEPEKKKEEPKKGKLMPCYVVNAYNQQLQHDSYYQQHRHQYQPQQPPVVKVAPPPSYYNRSVEDPNAYQQPPVAAVAPPSYFNRGAEEDPNACVIY